MFFHTLRRLAVSKAAIESYIDYLRNADRELPALSEILPRHQANTKELLQFHSLLCEVMQENGFNFMGIKVIPPSSAALQCLRWTDAVCVPLFSNAFQQTDFSVKQQRIHFVEPLFVLRLGRDAPSQLTANAAVSVCDTFRPGIELNGSRFPFYPPHATGFAADLGGCIGVCLGEETDLGNTSLDALGNHYFVMTRKDEPLQVGSGKNCLGGPSAVVALAVSYAVSMGKPLRTGHYVFCSGVGSRSPAVPGEYKVNYGGQMIIRIIGDSWVPEDKVLISVREDNEIKSSLPNIMKKLLIKRISGYKFYHTIGERKCDYGRPIDTHSTWKQIGVSSGSCIYLTKKEPSLKEEPTSTIDLVENKEKDQEVPMNIPTSDEVIDILPSADSVVITEESTHKDLMNHPQEVTRPIYTTTFNSSIQVGLTSQEESVALPVQPCSGKDEGQLPVSTGYQQNTDMTNQNHTSQSNKTLLLQESQHYLKKSGAAGPSYSPEVNYRCSYDSWAKASPIIEKPSTGREKRDLLLRRYERTAYMVSLYEFAHLELERQRRRAGEFLRGAQRGSFCSRTPQPKLLYKI